MSKPNNLKIYSKEEIKTGEYWIDGKAIYRKVFTFTTTSNESTTTKKSIDVSGLNIDTLINRYGSLDSSSTIYNLERCEGDNLYTRIELDGSKTSLLYVTRGPNSYYSGDVMMVIEYTKTTD